MKQLYGKLWVKCTAIALLVVFAILFAASALGTAYLFTYGAYADGGEQVRQIAENEILQQTNGDGWTALHAWVDDDKITRDLLRERYDPLTSNIYFKLTDKDTGKILFSTGALNKDDYTGKASAYYQQDMTASLDDGSDVTAVYQAYLKSPLAPNDRALYIMTWVNRLIDARYLLPVLAVLLLAACLFLFIFLLCAMGHKEGVDGIYQCWLNRIPLDLFALLLIFLFYAWATFVSEIWYINGWYYILLILGTAALALTLILSVAGRAKAPGFFKNTIVYMVFAWIFRGLGRIPMVWRTMLIWAGFCFIDLLLMFDGSSAAALWWLFSRGVLTVGILYLASSLKILQKEGQAIADGQTDYKGKPIPRWLPALKKHEENLQSIRSGIQKAVDEQTRAERMKTELITNVSHDIKTPLTSIISYVELLKREPDLPPHVMDYIKTISQKADRLNHIVQDVFEVSKAATGNISLDLEDLDIGKLLQQTFGEMEEDLRQSTLAWRVEIPDTPMLVHADGQRLYRVFQNLIRNCDQYALEGSRVYVNLTAQPNPAGGGLVTVMIRNISRNEITMDADHLTARFVRGDQNRTTEGSGLGLSIAKSFTEACGGRFTVHTDGDLFIVTVQFPLVMKAPVAPPAPAAVAAPQEETPPAEAHPVEEAPPPPRQEPPTE